MRFMLFPARWTRRFTRRLAMLLEEGIPVAPRVSQAVPEIDPHAGYAVRQ